MAFRYLIYRTDFGNTIVRESSISGTTTGGTEAELFTDFVIPEIQPLYLWRVTGGTSVIPNLDSNINDWLNFTNPPGPDDSVTYLVFTGYTAQTQTDLDGKINIVTGATGNIGEFDVSGNLVDTGYNISQLTGGTGSTTDIYVSGGTLNGTILELERSEGQANVNIELSGLTTGNTGGSGSGIFSAEYTFTNLVADTKPGAGFIKLNNIIPSAATFVYIDNLQAESKDVGNFYASLIAGDEFTMQQTIDSTNAYLFELTSDAIQTTQGPTGYVKLPVTPIVLNGTVPYNKVFAGMSYDGDSGNYVTIDTFTGYTATTDIRITNIEGDIITLSGDVATISGDVIQNSIDILSISGDVITLSGDVENIYTILSGLTGVTYVEYDTFTGYTATTDIRLGDIETITDIALTGASNGLQTIGRDVLLGGTLTIPTTIAGDGNSFVMTDLDQFFLGFSGVSTIQDSGSNGGIRYAADYSSSFIDRSLVDKAYVDAIASGLDLKESVRVATTTGEIDIDLTGGTFGGVIDGYTLLDGDRVLIKNQDASQKDNGIWVWSSGTSTFARAIDFDNPYVTAGAFTFVETGTTHASSGWVLTTQDPISVGTTPLTFTQFSEAGNFTAGVGIDITSNVISFDGASVAGTNLSWSGTQLNVFGLVDESVFTGYTAATDVRITNIETDISTISGDVITNTNNIGIVSAQTITNENNIITLSGDVENLYNIVSGLTGGSFVDIDTFTGYTATTDIRITNIETDISTISGDVITLSGDLITLSAETANKLDISVFTGYTASTQANELFVIHTGGTDLNTVAVTAIDWHSGITIGSAYSITAGTSTIEILETGEYEITYNVPFNQTSGGSDRAIGGNIVRNNVDIIDITAAAGFTTGSGYAGSVGLPSVNLSLSIGDKLDLVCFRTAKAGITNSSPNGSLLIKKKSTLQ